MGHLRFADYFSEVILEPQHSDLLHVVCGRFHATIAELTIVTGTVSATELKVLSTWPIQKMLLTSDLGHFFLVPPLAHLFGRRERNSEHALATKR